MRGQYGVAFVLGVLVAAQLAPARSETLRVGKAVGAAFPFVFVDIGVENGIFKKRGLDLEISGFGGGPRLIQAMTSDSIDIGIDKRQRSGADRQGSAGARSRLDRGCTAGLVRGGAARSGGDERRGSQEPQNHHQ